jgi:hypothetical protein
MADAEDRSGLRLVSVVGSVTPPGRLRRAVEEASERLRPLVADVELIDLAERRMSFAGGHELGSAVDDTGAVIEAIERAHDHARRVAWRGHPPRGSARPERRR